MVTIGEEDVEMTDDTTCVMKDYIQLDCDMPWIDHSLLQVHRSDEKGWPVHLTVTREDTQLDLHINFLLRREQVVQLRDFLDSVLKEGRK